MAGYKAGEISGMSMMRLEEMLNSLGFSPVLSESTVGGRNSLWNSMNLRYSRVDFGISATARCIVPYRVIEECLRTNGQPTNVFPIQDTDLCTLADFNTRFDKVADVEEPYS